MPNFSRIEIDGDGIALRRGREIENVAVEARRHGLSGLEFLEGIPGSVGGALAHERRRDGRRDFRCGRVGSRDGF